MSTATLPPGPRLPQPAQLVGWLKRPAPFLRRAHAEHGDVFSLKIEPGRTWVMLAHPDAVKEVFTGDPDKLRAGEGNTILEPFLGASSVLLLDGPQHLRQRKLLLPPFHGERMQRYGEIMREAAEREIATWRHGEPFALAERMQEVTLEVILRAVFGVTATDELAHLRRVLLDLLHFVTRPQNFLVLGILGPERVGRVPAFARVLAAVDAAVLAEIGRRRAVPDLAERDDILSMLLQATDEDGRGLTDRELRDELMTLLVAGHETTATALGWAFERLVRHPAWHERARAAAERGETAELDAVITETLRLRPVLPIVLRRLTEPMTLGGHDLPAGVFAAPCIFLVHRRPDLYPEPDAFRPERWLDGTKPGTYTWLPFGGGIRRCLGASFALFEMQVVLATVLREVRLRGDGGAERIGRRAITLTPERGARVVARAA